MPVQDRRQRKAYKNLSTSSHGGHQGSRSRPQQLLSAVQVDQAMVTAGREFSKGPVIYPTLITFKSLAS